jgi:drug/metabolite transporter (DMT)-like permease
VPDSPAPNRALLTLGLSVGILAASTAAIFIRFAQADGATSIAIAAARLMIATLILAPFVLARYRSSLRALRRTEWGLAALSGLFLALHFAFWISSLEYTSVASSVVLVSTTPLWVAMLAPLFLHEKIGRIAILGLALALTGGIIISISDACSWQARNIYCPPIASFFRGRALSGDFMALAGAGMATGYLLLGRKLRNSIPLLPYIFIVYGMAALVLLVIMLVMKSSPLGLKPTIYIWFILLALIPQLLGHSVFNWALKYLPASFVSVTLLGEPIGSTIFAYFIFRETPGWIKFGGALLLLAGIWLVSKNKY